MGAADPMAGTRAETRHSQKLEASRPSLVLGLAAGFGDGNRSSSSGCRKYLVWPSTAMVRNTVLSIAANYTNRKPW